MQHRLLIPLFLLPVCAHALDLGEALRLAEQHDVTFQAARASYQAGIEQTSQAQATILPQLSFDAFVSRTRSETSNSSSTTTPNGTTDFGANGYSLNLTQTIYNQAIFSALDEADAGAAEALAQFEDARQALVLRVATAYVDVLSAHDNLDFASAETHASAEQLTQAKERFKAGLTAITDQKEAQAQYDTSVARAIVASNALENAREALRIIVNDDSTPLRNVREQLPLTTPQPDDIKYWEDMALENNLTLRAAHYRSVAAQSAVAGSQAGHYPELSLNAVRSFNSSDGSTVSNAFSGRDVDQTLLMLNLAVPIYGGGHTSSLTRQRVAEYEVARAQHEQQRRLALQQVRNAFLGIKATISQVNALQQALISTQSALEATQEGFKAGTRNSVDVLLAQRELHGSERDYARARYDYMLNILELKRAAGLLAGADLQAMNDWLEASDR